MAQSPRTESATGDIEKQLQTIREDVSKLTKLVTQLGEDKVSSSVKSVRDEMEHLAGGVRKAADETAKRAKSSAHTVEDYVSERPVQTAVLALIVGLLIGTMSRR